MNDKDAQLLTTFLAKYGIGPILAFLVQFASKGANRGSNKWYAIRHHLRLANLNAGAEEKDFEEYERGRTAVYSRR